MDSVGRLAVAGVGLIGGSFALALRKAGVVDHVVGIGRDPANLQRAVERGVIDEIVSVHEAARSADIFLLATPVANFPALFSNMTPVLKPGCIVTDVGSTKRDVVEAAQRGLGAHFSRFVPAHPIAGAETSGVAAARADLFEHKQVVLTPTVDTDPEALERVRALWIACGARTTALDARDHDAIFSAVSHLPHVLAFALVEMLGRRPNAAELFSFCGSGFRDFTRIAASSPEMWRDIALANRDLLARDIDDFAAALATLKDALNANDAAALERLFTAAQASRSKLSQQC